MMLIALGFVGLMLASCQRDNNAIVEPDRPSVGISEDAIRMRVSVLGLGQGQTRATVDAVDGEEEVNSLYLLFFSPSSDRSGTFKGYYPVPGTLSMDTDIELTNLTSYGLNPSTAYKVLAVANFDQYAPYLGGITITDWLNSFVIDGTTENSAYKQTLAYISASEAIANDQILMAGEANKSDDPLGTLDLTLTRGMVRFDVVNSARAGYDLVSVSIWNAFPEISVFGGGLVNYNQNRIQRFYGIGNDNDPGGNGVPDDELSPTEYYYGDIFGGLYTFPNQVINPEAKDTKTTCLIVGLTDRSDPSAEPTYHRVNINSEDGMQDIKRNNVYRLTIRSVNGDGAGSEMEAYTGGINSINYKINYWDLDDDGLIQQNGNVILGIPTKRIKFGAEAEERSYDIFAFGGAPSEQIAVSSSLAAGLSVTQNGNSITVTATALTGAEEGREGTITITYAGLTATIGVIQSGTANQYLRVTTSSGSGIPSYPGYAGAAMDGTLTVEASGQWKAQLYHLGSSNYFTFTSGLDVPTFTSPTTPTGGIYKATVPIYTFLANGGVGAASRQAFVLISMNSDPDNYNSALVLTQKALGSISVAPNLTAVEWDGLGNLSTSGAGAINNTEYKFNVITPYDDGPPAGYEAWTTTVTEGDSYFEISDEGHSDGSLAGNYVTIRAKGETTAGSRTGTLRVALASDPTGTYVDIILRQTGYTMTVTPEIFTTKISSKGGETNAVTVGSNGSALTWSAEVLSTAFATGSTIHDHKAYLVKASDVTDVIAEGDANKNALSQTFRVKFPKVYYGDHMKGDITATVQIKLWSGTNEVGTKTITVNQSELTPNNVNLINYHGSGPNYGTIASGRTYDLYNWGIRQILNTCFNTTGTEAAAYPTATSPAVGNLYSPNSVSLPSSTSTAAVPATGGVMLYASRAAMIARGTGTDATMNAQITDWMNKQKNGTAEEGVLIVTSQVITYYDMLPSLTSAGWATSTEGSYAGSVYHSTNNPTLRNGGTSKVVDFVYNKGPFGAVNVSDRTMSGTNTYWYNDRYSMSVNISGAPGAVALVGSDTRASVVIDPVNRIVFIGEGQYAGLPATGFDTDAGGFTSLSCERAKFFKNIFSYAILTAQYGSSFSDLLIGEVE